MCTHLERILTKGGKPICWKGDYEEGRLRSFRDGDDMVVAPRARVIHLRRTYTIGKQGLREGVGASG